MTVCIAAVCRSHGAIIAASDLRASYEGDYIAEHAMLKWYSLDADDRWSALFADSSSMFVQVWRLMISQLAQHQGKTINADYMQQLARSALAVHLNIEVQRQVLRPLGFLTQQDFLDTGLQKLGQEEFSKQIKAMNAVKLPLDMLVFGFEGDLPHLFTTDGTGQCHDREADGYAAIGAGAYRAMDVLNDTPHFHRTLPLEEAIYRVCEAKFHAENNSGVGPSTLVPVHGSGGMEVLSQEALGRVRKAWEARQRMRPPSAALKAISGGLEPKPLR